MTKEKEKIIDLASTSFKLESRYRNESDESISINNPQFCACPLLFKSVFFCHIGLPVYRASQFLLLLT